MSSTTDPSDPNPLTILPTACAQTVASFYSILRHDTHTYEKGIHLLQTILAGARTGISIYLLYNPHTCNDEFKAFICTTLALCGTLYGATLLVTWVPSEVSKDPFVTAGNPTTAPTDGTVESQEEDGAGDAPEPQGMTL
ncbi:hypothetical protein [Legionella micdadei]|nr:hypothetical protein [Legionella micdadei]